MIRHEKIGSEDCSKIVDRGAKKRGYKKWISLDLLLECFEYYDLFKSIITGDETRVYGYKRRRQRPNICSGYHLILHNSKKSTSSQSGEGNTDHVFQLTEYYPS